jgi:hypothetical protein
VVRQARESYDESNHAQVDWKVPDHGRLRRTDLTGTNPSRL